MLTMRKNSFTKEEYERFLRSGIWIVEFRKKDDSLRRMVCTRNMDLIPVEKHPDTEDDVDLADKKVNPNVVVFDLEKKEWRSFSPNSVEYAEDFLLW